MYRGTTRIAIILIALLNCSPASAANEHNVTDEGLMLHGYDPVAYFEEASAREGSPVHTVRHEGVIYRFASASNKRKFLENPKGYTPAYGGYCSYGVRAGQKLDIDPTAWRIVDGRLFVQLDHGTRDLWMMDEELNIEVADSIWTEIRSEPSKK